MQIMMCNACFLRPLASWLYCDGDRCEADGILTQSLAANRRDVADRAAVVTSAYFLTNSLVHVTLSAIVLRALVNHYGKLVLLVRRRPRWQAAFVSSAG